jgi:hypothetical protein
MHVVDRRVTGSSRSARDLVPDVESVDLSLEAGVGHVAAVALGLAGLMEADRDRDLERRVERGQRGGGRLAATALPSLRDVGGLDEERSSLTT